MPEDWATADTGDDDVCRDLRIARANFTDDGERRVVFEIGGENDFVLRDSRD